MPKATGSCLAIMITPIDANKPWTAEEGKKLLSIPPFSKPKATWIAPATTQTASIMR